MEQVFEYDSTVFSNTEHLIKGINAQAESGWRVVSVVPTFIDDYGARLHGFLVIFERPKSKPKDEWDDAWML